MQLHPIDGLRRAGAVAKRNVREMKHDGLKLRRALEAGGSVATD